MSKTVRFAVSLDQNLLKDFDKAIEKKGYDSRSEAVRVLIRDQLVIQDWKQKEEAIGTITLVYDRHYPNLSDDINNIQYDYHDLIVSSMHVHFNYDNCLEIIAVKGHGIKIEELANALTTLKGIKNGELSLSTTGKEIT